MDDFGNLYQTKGPHGVSPRLCVSRVCWGGNAFKTLRGQKTWSKNIMIFKCQIILKIYLNLSPEGFKIRIRYGSLSNTLNFFDFIKKFGSNSEIAQAVCVWVGNALTACILRMWSFEVLERPWIIPLKSESLQPTEENRKWRS